VLQDFDEEPDGREGFRVGLEVIGIGRPIHDGISASLVDEQVLQGEGRPDDVLRKCFSRSGGGGRNADRVVDTESGVRA
jgi:hypothetical protein